MPPAAERKPAERILGRALAGRRNYVVIATKSIRSSIGRTVEQLSHDWGLRPHQVSLAWLLSRPAVASVIVGAETVDELTANASAAELVLEQGQLDALTTLEVGNS